MPFRVLLACAAFAALAHAQQTSRDSISGRYVFNDTYEAGVPLWGKDERDNLGRAQNYASTWMHTFAPTLVNELRGGWSKFYETEIFGTTDDPEFDIAGKMEIPLVSRLPKEHGPPTISISGPAGAFAMYNLHRQIGPRDRSNRIFQFADNLSWQRGKHFFNIGADIARRAAPSALTAPTPAAPWRSSCSATCVRRAAIRNTLPPISGTGRRLTASPTTGKSRRISRSISACATTTSRSTNNPMTGS